MAAGVMLATAALDWEMPKAVVNAFATARALAAGGLDA
jgi:hypothetical protein